MERSCSSHVRAVFFVGKPSILGALTSLTCPNVFLKYALLRRPLNARFFSRLLGNSGAFHSHVPWENNCSKLEWPKQNKQKNQGFFFFFFLLLVGGVKHTVLLQRKLFEGNQPAPSCTRIREAKESKAQKRSSALSIKGII